MNKISRKPDLSYVNKLAELNAELDAALECKVKAERVAREATKAALELHEAKKNFLHSEDQITARRSNNRIMMNFRFPLEFKYTIKQMARQEDVSMTKLLMRALDHYGQQRQGGREL